MSASEFYTVQTTRTSDAPVIDFQVALELFVARANSVECGFDNLHGTAPSSRAAPIKKVEHVRETADKPEVGFDTASELHATVERRRHNDDFVFGTSSVKRLVVAVLLRATERRRLRQLNSRRLLPRLSYTANKHCDNDVICYVLSML